MAELEPTREHSRGLPPLCRRPSVLRELISDDLRSLRPVRPWNDKVAPARSSTSSPSSAISEICDDYGSGVTRWSKDEIAAWLCEIDFPQYQSVFEEQGISNGRVLLQLKEEHLKEMGVAKVGHRLEIVDRIQQLQRAAGLVSGDALIDMSSLVGQLDVARSREHLKLYPKRIILVRHAESSGNIDKSLYATVPDNKLTITENGVQQSLEAGRQLKELIKNETVTFYVSPFVRSKQTHEHIQSSFSDDQVKSYEDPRLREQEWGNFQDPTRMEAIIQERRKIGSFYYRFPTGESGADVYDRVSMFLETMYRAMKRGYCGENAIIISHGLFCRLFLMRFYHWTVETFHRMWNFQNGQFVVMELQPNGTYNLESSKLRFDD